MLTKINVLLANFILKLIASILGFKVQLYLTAYRFYPRVQSSTCTTYGKHLRESIMAVITAKSGVYLALLH